MLRMTIQLPPDEGARLLSAIECAAEVERVDRAGGDRGDDDRTPPSKADGLVVLAESFFADGARPRRGGAPNEVVLHVPAGTLAANGEGAFIENHDGRAVPRDTARKLACDARVTTVTSSTGSTAARRSWRTSACCAGGATLSCMSAASRSSIARPAATCFARQLAK